MNDAAKTRDFEDRIKSIIADLVGTDPSYVTAKKRFKEDLKADSLAGVEIAMAVENEFGFQIADEDMEKLTTVASLIEYVKQHSPQ